jgi:hypothetical protein
MTMIEDRLRQELSGRAINIDFAPDLPTLHRVRKRSRRTRRVFAGAAMATVLLAGAVMVSTKGQSRAPISESVGGPIPLFGFALEGPQWTTTQMSAGTDPFGQRFQWLMLPKGGDFSGPTVSIATGTVVTNAQPADIETIAGRVFRWSDDPSSKAMTVIEPQANLTFVGRGIDRLTLTDIIKSVTTIDGVPSIGNSPTWDILKSKTPSASSMFQRSDGRTVVITATDIVDAVALSSGDPLRSIGSVDVGGVGSLPAYAITPFNTNEPGIAAIDRKSQRAVVVTGSPQWTMDELRAEVALLVPIGQSDWLQRSSIVETPPVVDAQDPPSTQLAAPSTDAPADAPAGTTAPAAPGVDGKPVPAIDRTSLTDSIDQSLISAGTCDGAPGVIFGSRCFALGTVTPASMPIDLTNEPGLGGGRAVVLDLGIAVDRPGLSIDGGRLNQVEAADFQRRNVVVKVNVDGRDIIVVVEAPLPNVPKEPNHQALDVSLANGATFNFELLLAYRPATSAGRWQPLFSGASKLGEIFRKVLGSEGAPPRYVRIRCAPVCEFTISYEGRGVAAIEVPGGVGGRSVSRSVSGIYRYVTVSEDAVAVTALAFSEQEPASFDELERQVDDLLRP